MEFIRIKATMSLSKPKQTLERAGAAAHLPETPETIECRNPATLERLGDVPIFSRVDVAERVARAQRAQVAWSRTSFAERRRVLRKLLDYIVAHQDEIARQCARDSGKTLVDAAIGEIFPVCEKIRYTLAHGERDLTPERRSSGVLIYKAARVEYHPLGVIGVICPWNFPFHNVLCPTIPALFAGNAVICKVSEWASCSSADFQAIFTEVLQETGHSPDLVQLITGAGETGQALVTSGVQKIFFTGSPENGRRVMRAAAETLTPVVLELGGKDPMIVCDDADLDQAVSAAMLGVFTACGQMCVGAERLYVMDGIYERFVEKITEKVQSLRQGPPSFDDEGEFDVGAMTMPRQLEIIERQLADATQKGARLLCGGRRNPNFEGQFFEPTVLVDVNHDMVITREETFGPVLTIMRVYSETEAIRLANDSAYGLGSSVFSKDPKRAERIAAAISAGMTVVNDYGIAYMMQSAPFGGVRISGVGKINGREGLRACTNEKTVVVDRVPFFHPAISFYPMKPGTFGLLSGTVGLLYGGNLMQRSRAALKMARALMRRFAS
jgi:acyl-CoA reductase-like NAD-dependent aldehyde dehydrogenase